MLLPATESELIDIVRSSVSEAAPLALIGHGTKSGWGRPVVGKVVSLRRFSGIIDYAPAELVMTVGAGTPLIEIEQVLKGERQHLAFEPTDLGPLYGAPANQATIGGVIACNLSGPRRPFAGAARDFFLGFKGVNGSGAAIKAGAKVVKNVTGYDLPKLIAGSFGTLVALTEVTLKVVPAPETSCSLALENIDVFRAERLMTEVLGSTAEPSGAAYLPAPSRLVFRLEGAGPSVAYRLGVLQGLAGAGRVLDATESVAEWQKIRDLDHFEAPESPVLWVFSVPPATFSQGLAQLLAALPASKFSVDWGGGRLWLAHSLTDMPTAVRAVHSYLGGQGHATLLRAPDEWRKGDRVFSPDVPVPLLQKVRAAFDPKMIFNRGRLHPDL
jgi:glycolate oxidase FAD binding subunit